MFSLRFQLKMMTPVTFLFQKSIFLIFLLKFICSDQFLNFKLHLIAFGSFLVPLSTCNLSLSIKRPIGRNKYTIIVTGRVRSESSDLIIFFSFKFSAETSRWTIPQPAAPQAESRVSEGSVARQARADPRACGRRGSRTRTLQVRRGWPRSGHCVPGRLL